MNGSRFQCGVCEKSSVSQNGLYAHAFAYHRGVAHEVWEPGWKSKRGKNGAHRPAPMSVTDLADRRPVTTDDKVRRRGQAAYGAILRERPANETITNLPWVKYPKTAEECAIVARQLGSLLDSPVLLPCVREFLASQRAYVLALGDRLAAAHAA